MSLKNRLFLLIISLSTFGIIASTYLTLEIVRDIFETQKVENINHDKKVIESVITSVQENLKQFSSQIALDEDIKNSMNLISHYENPKNYQPEVFDVEKILMLESAQKWIKVNESFSLGFFDKNGKLIALNRKLSQKHEIGYLSYIEGQKVFKEYGTETIFSLFPAFAAINDQEFETYFYENSYFVTYTQKLFLNQNLIGFVRLGFSINEEFVTQLNSKLKTQLLLSSNTHYILQNNLTMEQFRKMQQSDDYSFEEELIFSGDSGLKAHLIVNKKELNEKFFNIYAEMFLIWIAILMATFLISFNFLKNSVITPLENLKESIKNIKNNKYQEIKTVKNDEISSIIKEFNKLSKNLQDNISFLNSYKHVMDEGSIVTKSDLKGNITYANDNFYKVSGYTKNETLGSPHNIVRDPETPKAVFEDLWETIKAKKVWKGVLKNRKKDGNPYWVDIVIQPIFNSKNEIIEYIAVRHEVTELIQQREKLDNLVNRDILTNLGNRFKLGNDIYKHQKSSIAILNVDNFRQVNDFYGHAFGDRLIRKIAMILSNLIINDESYELYRLQGDEFVILNSIHPNSLFYDKIKNILNFIDNDNIVVDTEQLSVKMTAAISFESNDKILQTADMALQIARKKNIDMVVYDDENSLNKEYENNLKWTKKIKEAIEEDRVVPFFQPIVNNKNNHFEKYESLIRIIDGDKVISPFFFLEISKKTKYYNILTKIMLEKSFEVFSDKDLEFSVNLTVNDILNIEIQDYIFELLNRYGIGKRVVFEIVESESIENFNEVVSFIRNVKAFGCKIAIDDFGTGYSNFEYLMKLEADYIKIDGSMIKNIDTDKNARMVVETIVSFAKKMDMKTIAEFVENESILSVVNELEIDYSQGYHFSAPKPEISV